MVIIDALGRRKRRRIDLSIAHLYPFDFLRIVQWQLFLNVCRHLLRVVHVCTSAIVAHDKAPQTFLRCSMVVHVWPSKGGGLHEYACACGL